MTPTNLQRALLEALAAAGADDDHGFLRIGPGVAATNTPDGALIITDVGIAVLGGSVVEKREGSRWARLAPRWPLQTAPVVQEGAAQ